MRKMVCLWRHSTIPSEHQRNIIMIVNCTIIIYIYQYQVIVETTSSGDSSNVNTDYCNVFVHFCSMIEKQYRSPPEKI